MSDMFRNSSLFDQDLGSWHVDNVTDMTDMFTGSSLSETNYDAILTGWNTRPLLQDNVQLDSPAQYCAAESDRDNIILTYSWTINDAGSSCASSVTTASEQIDINVEVTATLSLDCYDKAGTTGDHDVNLGNVTAGTPVTASSTCNVTTNDDSGYYLALENSSTQGSTGDVLEYQDPNNSSWYSIDDYIDLWDDTTIGGTTGTDLWGTSTGLGFSVEVFPDTNLSNNNFSGTEWGTGICGAATMRFAGVPATSNAQTIAAVTQYEETTTTTDTCYIVDVPSSQPSGVYTGQVTYTATSDASSYHN